MATAVAAKVGKPTKGVKPNFEGVRGELVKSAELPAGIVFGFRRLHSSPYDALLNQLVEAGTGQVLCFGNPRARCSITVRSRKLNIKVEYGEHLGKLYVRLAPGSTAPDESAASAPLSSVKDTVASGQKTRKRSLIMTAIRQEKHSPEAIAAFMRQEYPAMDAPIVRSMLKQMQIDGSVTLAKSMPETWELAA